MADKMKTLQATKGLLSAEAPARMLPSFSLTAKDLPAIKGWQVGKRYRLEIEVEQVASEKDEYQLGRPLTARFRIHKVRNVSLTDEEMKGRKGH